MTTTAPPPHTYRLTRPDGLGFFRRRSGIQFAVCCVGVGFALLGIAVGAIGVDIRLGVGITGTLLIIVGAGRSPAGEDLVDLLSPSARFALRKVRRRDRWAAGLSPWRDVELPPIFGGITLLDAEPSHFTPPGNEHRSSRAGRFGLVLDKGDGSVSAVLRVYGDGFLLADSTEQDARVAAFGDALASVGREESAVVRVAWSQFCAPCSVEAHLDYLDAFAKDDPDPTMRDAYLGLVGETGSGTVRTEVLVTLTVGIDRVRVLPHRDRFSSAVDRLLEEVDLFAGALERAQLSCVGPLPAGAIARALRDRLDPSAMWHLDTIDRSFGDRSVGNRTFGDVLGLVTPTNAFPVSVTEQRCAIVTDNTWHRLFRVSEWPRVAVRADWLASFLCDSSVTRNFTVVFSPQPRRLARRQALAVATRVGATIDERESHGRRVGAEERRAQAAAEALDEELEQGAGMELLLGLVDVTAESEEALLIAADKAIQGAANVGMELRPIELRQAEALVCALPLGRVVLGRAR